MTKNPRHSAESGFGSTPDDAPLTKRTQRRFGRARWAGALALWASVAAAESLPAFPAAEGFGASATGGRGKAVAEVTNLNDDGPGSLRDAISGGDRTVVFRVSGTINLNSRLKLNHPNITIAGQTAPGDGICLRGHELFIADTENVIVRYLRLRPGDESKTELDALTVWNAKDVIIDHCSLSWSTDSLNDVVKQSGNVTVQWCILSEPLVRSVHSKGSHGYATGWDGRTKGGGSFHHNLIAHAASRAPRIGYFKVDRGLIDCRNNVIYNSGPSYGGEGDDFNFVGNYYRPGPDSERLRKKVNLFDVWSADTRMYVADNVYEGQKQVAADNRAAVSFNTNADATTKKGDAATCLVDKPFDVPQVTTQPAERAYELIIAQAGATLPARDAVDVRIINDVKNRSGKPIDSPTEVGGWPELKSAEAPADGDHDGMPDAWESKHGLDPNDPSDGAKAKEAGGYTNLEVYLNELATPASS